VDPLRPRESRVAEPGSRYIDFLVPGLLGMNLMGTGMWGLGFSIVNARVRKLLKRLAATPMRRSEYLLSQMLARLVFLVFEVAILVGFGWFAFGVEVRGSVAALAFVSLLGAASFSGLGLLISSRTKTIEGVSGLMNLAMLPMWLLSGTFFSWERFPEAAHPFIRALPLTALNDALRAVMTEGRPLSTLGLELGVLAITGVVSFLVAVRIFRWQ
jgi:ABC transporter DrrB family efflux protein